MGTVADYLALEAVRLEDASRCGWTSIRTRCKSRFHRCSSRHWSNGIKYGVATRVEGGVIHLKSRFKDNFLEVGVSNSGSYDEKANPDGVGLKNSAERLKLLFGEQASINLESSVGDGVTAAIRIPLETEKQ